MIKGWKNDPKWVAYYEAKKENDAQKKIAKAKIEHNLAVLMDDCDEAMRAARMSFVTARPLHLSL